MRDEEVDAPGDAWLSADEPVTFEAKDHLVDGRRADAEVSLHVGLGGRLTEHTLVDTDEGQVVALLHGEAVRASGARCA